MQGNRTQTEVVYFMRGQESGLIKIGTTRCRPELRMAGVQTGSNEQIELLWTVPGGRDLEAAYHRVFAGLRVRGEWFRDLPPQGSPELDPAAVEARAAAIRAGVIQEYVDALAAVKDAEAKVNATLGRFPPGIQRRRAIRMALAHGWTQCAVARALGISHTRVAQIIAD